MSQQEGILDKLQTNPANSTTDAVVVTSWWGLLLVGKRGMRKTIVEHMRDVILENECRGVMWGDCRLMDECASRATHTTLMDAHPLDRHQRILNALENSPLFEKFYIKLPVRFFPKGGWMERDCRFLRLRELEE